MKHNLFKTHHVVWVYLNDTYLWKLLFLADTVSKSIVTFRNESWTMTENIDLASTKNKGYSPEWHDIHATSQPKKVWKKENIFFLIIFKIWNNQYRIGVCATYEFLWMFWKAGIQSTLGAMGTVIEYTVLYTDQMKSSQSFAGTAWVDNRWKLDKSLRIYKSLCIKLHSNIYIITAQSKPHISHHLCQTSDERVEFGKSKSQRRNKTEDAEMLIFKKCEIFISSNSHAIVKEEAETEIFVIVRKFNCQAWTIVESAKRLPFWDWQKVILNDVGTYPFANLALSFSPADSNCYILLINKYWLTLKRLLGGLQILAETKDDNFDRSLLILPWRENSKIRGPKLKNNRTVHFTFSKRRIHKCISLKEIKKTKTLK